MSKRKVTDNNNYLLFCLLLLINERLIIIKHCAAAPCLSIVHSTLPILMNKSAEKDANNIV